MRNKQYKYTPTFQELMDLGIKEIEEQSTDLSISQLLILGANPLGLKMRSHDDIIVIRDIVNQKLEELLEQRDTILTAIVNDLYSREMYEKIVRRKGKRVTNYFEKYEELVNSPGIDNIEDAVLTESITDYRRALADLKTGNNSSRSKNKCKIADMEKLEDTPVNLVYFDNEENYLKSQPYRIVTKRKVSERISSKIPYCILINYIRMFKSNQRRWFNKKELNLDACNIGDIAGIKITTHDFLDDMTNEHLAIVEIKKIKEYITKSPDIKVSDIIKVLDTENYYLNHPAMGEIKRIKGYITQSPDIKVSDIIKVLDTENYYLNHPAMGEIKRIKEYITQSPDIMVLDMENYYQKPTGDYRAIHLDTVWSPNHKEKGIKLDPLFTRLDSVETILTELKIEIASETGSNSYWRRMNAQIEGIPKKHLDGQGKLKIDYFTKKEKEWKEETERRIMKILTLEN